MPPFYLINKIANLLIVWTSRWTAQAGYEEEQRFATFNTDKYPSNKNLRGRTVLTSLIRTTVRREPNHVFSATRIVGTEAKKFRNNPDSVPGTSK